MANFRNTYRRLHADRRPLFPLGGPLGRARAAARRDRAPAVPGLAECALQRLVQHLLHGAAEQGLEHLHLADRRVQRAGRLLHRQRRLSALSPAMAADQVAELAHPALSRPLARPGHALPHAAERRSGRQPRPAHRRRHPPIRRLHARYRHRAARLDRHAGVVRGDPVDPVVGHAADDRLADLQRPRLSRLGGADLCGARHLGHPSRRPPAGEAQFRSAALRGGFPLLAGALARECRGGDAARGRAGAKRRGCATASAG